MAKAIALLINDLHISKDNASEFEQNWNEAIELCLQHEIKDLIVGGDMFTTRSSQTLSTLLTVHHAIRRAVNYGLSVTIAEGNHDKVDPEEIEGYNHLWVGLDNVDVVDDFAILAWNDCDYFFVPISYFPESGSFDVKLQMLKDELENSHIDPSKVILYLHEGIHGALGSFEIPNELPQDLFSDFKAVLCGHYHNRVKIKDTNIEYIGSSRQHNFGEDENKGYTVIFDDGSYGFIQNQTNKRYKTVEIDADDLKNYKLDRDSKYNYRVKVKCTEQQAKTFSKHSLIDMGFDKVEVISESQVSKESAAAGIQEKYDKQGIKREYQNYCDENDIDSKLGLKYLEG